MLQTRENKFNPQRLLFRNLNSLQQSHMRASRPTRILIHGWLEDEESNINANTAAELLDYNDFNIIIIDWSEGSQTINYIGAANRVPTISTLVASYIDFLHENTFVDFRQLTVVGFSLGGNFSFLIIKECLKCFNSQLISLASPGSACNAGSSTQLWA